MSSSVLGALRNQLDWRYALKQGSAACLEMDPVEKLHFPKNVEEDDDVILISEDEMETGGGTPDDDIQLLEETTPVTTAAATAKPLATSANVFRDSGDAHALSSEPADLISKVCTHGPLRTVAAAIETLNEEIFVCDSNCMCKVSRRAQESINHHRRERARPLEIVNHKWHGGHLFLHCKLDSERTCLEYLKVCQIPANIRREYSVYLENCQKIGKLPKPGKKWTVQDDLALRERLYPSLTKEQIRCQEGLTNCTDTAEWEVITRNGRGTVTLPRAQKVPETSRPKAVLETATEEFYEVERVIAAELEMGKISYLIKWIGYPLEESTWEPQSAVQMSRDAVDQFISSFGKPNKTNPKIFSPEGNTFLEKIAAKAKKKKK
ncbi:uncharacterized protein LOC129581859 [Paramacrobiotus metropolitanus]|uniref:uncharacterized protein LOC129581859 n=1 Tax=Paramacrobiotus metropolitanus TaxID=2943436 RepID=UPI00244642E7|nr:uncharacterized protein LOC129581859 [Paramacrobiotus metropolitanus]